ncbi:hypothetical protein F442_01113 [Phytophthora nicotianae P10297]|uniref:Uncharacterized protein n=1 Tax=Phytophthora nicotianae P10297 TaxID=1317064 RepID=W3A356_PHYNI|nr:hypothetical protein F442_01113 [Phytophthora nicotianae P10297]
MFFAIASSVEEVARPLQLGGVAAIGVRKWDASWEGTLKWNAMMLKDHSENRRTMESWLAWAGAVECRCRHRSVGGNHSAKERLVGVPGQRRRQLKDGLLLLVQISRSSAERECLCATSSRVCVRPSLVGAPDPDCCTARLRFGITGRLGLRWCETFHHSRCMFVPDAIQLLWVLTCKYARATGEAAMAVIERTGHFLVGTYLTAARLQSMLVYLPRLVYESVEGVLGGWIDVAFVTFVVDVYLEFTVESCYWSVAVLVVGCYSHGLRDYGAWRFEEMERASLERLRGVQAKGTPTEAQAASATSNGTPKGGVPEVSADKTVRPSSGGAARRGRRGLVGENCHGLQLDGGLAILVDCIQKVCNYRLNGLHPTSKGKRSRRRRSMSRVGLE